MKRIRRNGLKLFVLGMIGLLVIQINVNHKVNAAIDYKPMSLYMRLKENGKVVALYHGTEGTDGEILKNLINREVGEVFVLGKEYQRSFCIDNPQATGENGIDQYIRVVIYKSWSDEDGYKVNVSPNLINLNLNEEDWLKLDKNSNENHVELLYSKALCVGETTTNFMNGFSISPNIKNEIEITVETIEDNNQIVTLNKKYQKVKPYIEIRVDSMQRNNIDSSDIKSAWNIDVEIGSDGTLTLL